MPASRKRIFWTAAAVVIAGGVIAAAAAPGAPAADPPMSTVPGAGGVVTFDHTIHAGKYGIQCLDCHAYADKSPVAGVPSERKCMGCHKFVAKDKPAIKALAAHFEAGEPLKWPRVFWFPDLVYFTHRMHIRAKVACAECHGDVAAMHTVRQERPFTMGRCIACHVERHARRDCLACHK